MDDAPALGIESLSIRDSIGGEPTRMRALGRKSTELEDALIIHGQLKSRDPDSAPAVAWRDLLPTELWCCVWQHLPLGDRVSVTQVCGAWRELALHTATLWTRLDFYTTRYLPDCARNDWFGQQHQPGSAASSYPANSSNEKVISRVLELSSDLELELSLYIVPYACDFRTLTALGAALSGHRARIAHLSCVTGDPQGVAYLLFGFTCFPALRTIRLFPGPGYDWLDSNDTLYMGFLIKPIDLPRLELLDLRKMPATIWPHGHPALRFPRLQSLALHVGRMGNLVHALRACPGVTSLRLTLDVKAAVGDASDWENWRQADADDVLQSLSSCRVEGLRAIDERGQLLGAFLNPGRKSLTLEYLNFPREQGFGILRDAGPSSDIRLVVLECNGFVVVRTDAVGVASDGRTRQLMFPSKDPLLKQRVFKRIWADDILLAHVRHLSLTDSMWAPFLSTVPPDNRLDRVDLIVNMGSTFADLIVADFSPSVRLPSLTILSLIGSPGAVLPVPAAAEIATFVRRVGSVLPLSTLVLDRRLMPHEPISGSWESFALCVRIH